MLIPAKRVCDICGKGIDIKINPITFPVIIGEFVTARVEMRQLDICDHCLRKATNVVQADIGRDEARYILKENSHEKR